jgi:uncharacterized membrane protein YhaH (DUF805 family)
MKLVHLFFSTQGRVNRRTYWSIVGIWFAITLLLSGSVKLAASLIGNEVVVAVFFWAAVVFYIASYFPMAALKVKRLHDSGRTGWWLLFQHGLIALGAMTVSFFGHVQTSNMNPDGLAGKLIFMVVMWFVCWLGMLLLFVLTLWPGEDGKNEYGFN